MQRFQAPNRQTRTAPPAYRSAAVLEAADQHFGAPILAVGVYIPLRETCVLHTFFPKYKYK